MGSALQPRRTRSGVTLVEIMVVVAIMTIMAAVGATIMRDLIPRWRARRAAYEFAGWVQYARDRSVAEGLQYRVRVFGDPTIDADTPSAGNYQIARGNASIASNTWDILPVEGTGFDSLTDQGSINLARDQNNALVDVSILGSATTPVDLVVGPRGWLDNPATDFDSEGYINVTFVNKRAHLAGATDFRTVKVSRTGMTRIGHATSTFPEDPIGTGATSNTAASTGSGYRGG